MLASWNGHLQVVKYLVQTVQMDVQDEDADGWTAIDYAEDREHDEIVAFFMS
jgi:ankyrin repeat protein